MTTDSELKLINRHADAVDRAEKQIQRLLIDLADKVGKIESVDVDTRRFASYCTAIFIKQTS